MYGTIRQYTGASELVEKLHSDQANVAELLRAAPGFVAYYAIRTDDGVATVSICDDKAGAEETTRIAAKYVRDNLSDGGSSAVGAPRVSGGEIIVRA
jgi:predicted transcriptional regulator